MFFIIYILFICFQGVNTNKQSQEKKSDDHSKIFEKRATTSYLEEQALINGFNLDSNEASMCKEGLVEFEVKDHRAFIFAFTQTSLRVHGRNFKNTTALSFTTKEAKRGDDCTDLRSTEVLFLKPDDDSHNSTAQVNVSFSLQAAQQSQVYYVCIKDDKRKDNKAPVFIHQGTGKWVQLVVVTRPQHSYMLPMWLQITLVIVLLCLSGLFSGLNLGLMSLNVTELNILVNSGSASEKKYAKIILPLRKKGNYLLCTILLSNVLVNNTLAILLDDLTMNGMLAIVGATFIIVIFGEIIPQSICSRYGLMVGAKTILFTKLFMVVTFPLSYPISLFLDCVLGKELGYVFTRERLRELIRLTGDKTDLESEEVKIIVGALELSRKTIFDVMTKIERVFMLEDNCLLDFETLIQISKTGFSRIPVFHQHRNKIVALLNVKDLTFVNPCDRTPLKTITSFHKRQVNFYPANTRLDVLLHKFKSGNPHMAFVESFDDAAETIGVITLKDIVQEILGSKINDQFDCIYGENGRFSFQRPLLGANRILQADQLSPQMALATLRFLSTSIVAFDSTLICEEVLEFLLCQNDMLRSSSSDSLLYEVGKPTTMFCMVLEGRVKVYFGKDQMVFEGGPFFYFGVQAILGSKCCAEKPTVENILEEGEICLADCTVKAINKVQYVCIDRNVYLQAIRATLKFREQHLLKAIDYNNNNVNVETSQNNEKLNGHAGRSTFNNFSNANQAEISQDFKKDTKTSSVFDIFQSFIYASEDHEDVNTTLLNKA